MLHKYSPHPTHSMHTHAHTCTHMHTHTCKSVRMCLLSKIRDGPMNMYNVQISTVLALFARFDCARLE